MLPQQGIDICICTFNRVEYLRQCVDLLLPQLNQNGRVLTIVNNNSTDSTEEYVKSVMEQHSAVRYFFEPAQGISHARNRGWKESTHAWIFYIDDECLPDQGLISDAFKCIHEHGDIAAIGGPIYPKFITTKPEWLPEGFGEFKMPFDQFTVIDRGYIRCGCFLTQRNVLEKLGGFSEDLGMKGYKLAYGEELELQDRLRAQGYKIAYDPALAIDHQVRVEKLNTWWILHSEYARRRDKMTFAPIGLGKAFTGFLRTLGGRVIHLPVYSFKLISQKDYTFRNAILDFMKPLMYRSGELIGVLRNLRK